MSHGHSSESFPYKIRVLFFSSHQNSSFSYVLFFTNAEKEYIKKRRWDFFLKIKEFKRSWVEKKEDYM